MAKVIKAIVKTAVAFVVAVAIIVLTAVTFGTFLAVTIATYVAQAIFIGTALSSFASIFRKTPAVDQATLDSLRKRIDPNASRKIVFGTRAGGSDVIFQEIFGSKKDKIIEIVALASHRIAGVKTFYVKEKLAANADRSYGNGGTLQVQSEFSGKFNGAWQDGSQTSTLSPVGSGSYWTGDCVMRGVALLFFNSVLDPKKWPEGVPDRMTTVIDGCPVYDPRNPVCDINNQDTWIFNTVDPTNVPGRNPALQVLTFMIGWRQNGKLQWGLGLPVHRILMSNMIQYANLADELILDKNGNQVRRYQCDIIFGTDATRGTVFDSITATMGSAKVIDAEGRYQFIGGFDDTLGPVVSFDDSDLVGAADYDPAAPLAQQYNIVRGRYVEPKELYQLVDYPELRTAPLADGIDRTLPVEFAGVTRPDYAQRLAKQWLIRSQFTGRFKGVFGPKAFAVKVGSLVRLSFSRRGWNGKLFRVMSQDETHELIFDMMLQEESALIYQFDANEATAIPAVLRPPLYDPNDTEQVQGLNLVARNLPGADSDYLTYVDIFWTPETSGRVAGIQLDIREVGGTTWQPLSDGLFDASNNTASTPNPAPGRAVEVRARFRMIAGNYGIYSYASITTPSVPRANYQWLAYADSPDGSQNFTTGAPGARRYVGIAVNKSTPVESSNFADYQWQPGTVAKRIAIQNATPVSTQSDIDNARVAYAASFIPVPETWATLQSVSIPSALGVLVTLDFALDFVAELISGNYNSDSTSRVVRITRTIGGVESVLGTGSFTYQDGLLNSYSVPGAAWLPAFRSNVLRTLKERFSFSAIDTPPAGAAVVYQLQIARYWPGTNSRALISSLEVIAQEINAT